MRKIIIGLSILILTSGCDSEMKTLTCNSTTEANGVTTTTNYKVKYQDDDIKHIIITYDYTQEKNEKTDGTNADTDGLDKNDTTDNDNRVESDEVIDGVVGDTIDDTVEGVKDTILGIAGIKDTFQNQMSMYDNMEGLTYKIDTDNDNEYKVTYEIDLNKISDEDLTRFNAVRNLTDLKSNFESSGYTCK